MQTWEYRIGCDEFPTTSGWRNRLCQFITQTAAPATHWHYSQLMQITLPLVKVKTWHTRVGGHHGQRRGCPEEQLHFRFWDSKVTQPRNKGRHITTTIKVYLCKVSASVSIVRKKIKRENMALPCVIYSYFITNVYFGWLMHSSRT